MSAQAAGEGRAGICVRMALGWRAEIGRIAAQRKVTVNRLLLEVLAREFGLGGLPARAVARPTVTERWALEREYPGDAEASPWVAEVRRRYPGRWAAARGKRAGASRAQGVAGGAEGEVDPSSPREDPGGWAGRHASGPNSGDAP